MTIHAIIQNPPRKLEATSQPKVANTLLSKRPMTHSRRTRKVLSIILLVIVCITSFAALVVAYS